MQQKQMSDQTDQQRHYLESNWFAVIEDEVRLMGSKCQHCGKVSFPVKPFCPSCYEETQENVPLSRTGTLHTFALSVMGPKDMEKPYVIGFIDLPEGIKLYSVITECEPWDKRLKIGMPMRMLIAPIKKDGSGNTLIGYKFAPCEEEEAV